jgi:hypothetical protein
MVTGEPLRRGASKAARSTPARSSAVMPAPFGHQLTYMRTRPLRRMTTRRASSFSTLESGAGDTEIAASKRLNDEPAQAVDTLIPIGRALLPGHRFADKPDRLLALGVAFGLDDIVGVVEQDAVAALAGEPHKGVSRCVAQIQHMANRRVESPLMRLRHGAPWAALKAGNAPRTSVGAPGGIMASNPAPEPRASTHLWATSSQ